MSPPLRHRANIKHCREIYMAVRGVEQNAKHQRPTCNLQYHPDPEPTDHLSAFTPQPNRSGTSIITCLQNERGRHGGVEAIFHI